MNLPNYISLARLFSVPILIWVLSSSWFNSTNGERELVASLVFIAASITDAIDGYLARRNQQVTTMGILLDTVADKLLITGAFVTLVQFNPRIVPPWMAVIVIGREILVTGLRSIAATEGFSIPASELGKTKMVVQIVSVVAAIVDHHWAHLPWYFLSIPVHPVALISIWIMVGLSLISAIDYFVGFWKVIDRSAVQRRKRSAFVLTRRSKRDVPVI